MRRNAGTARPRGVGVIQNALETRRGVAAGAAMERVGLEGFQHPGRHPFPVTGLADKPVLYVQHIGRHLPGQFSCFAQSDPTSPPAPGADRFHPPKSAPAPVPASVPPQPTSHRHDSPDTATCPPRSSPPATTRPNWPRPIITTTSPCAFLRSRRGFLSATIAHGLSEQRLCP